MNKKKDDQLSEEQTEVTIRFCVDCQTKYKTPKSRYGTTPLYMICS